MSADKNIYTFADCCRTDEPDAHDEDEAAVQRVIEGLRPHFLYNALAAIKTTTRRDPNKAYDLIQELTVYLRGSIRALSCGEPISFEEELDGVRAYLALEQARFGEKLRVQYDIGCESFAVVPGSVQTLAENAVKHGIFPKGREGGTVSVRSYDSGEAYVVEVQDDGAGFDAESVLRAQEAQHGLSAAARASRERLGAVLTCRSAAGEGALVSLILPKYVQKDGDTNENDRG